jgi:hypothetical protein
MSNHLAISAATATLRHLLETGFNGEGVGVTTLPPDLSKSANETGGEGGAGAVNLFLYHTQPNAAWRNQNLPNQAKPGETAQPALALDLYYLVTAYGADAGTPPHGILGRAMSTLHDHPLLGGNEIKGAFSGSDLENQIERVRITPHPLSVEELSKLWVIFQTEYRLSAAYQVSVVLIESTRGSRTPLPVLSRGRDDRGVSAQADLSPPFPSLTAIGLPERQRNATLGTLLTIQGNHLDGSGIIVEAAHPRLPGALPLTLQPGGTDLVLSAKIPVLPNAWAAGFYSLTVRLTKTGETFERSTNALPFALAPEITNTSVARTGDDVKVTLKCRPEVLPEQRASLLIGDREVVAPVRTAALAELEFAAGTSARPISAGKYFVRLRVDGVDSELVKFTGQPPRPAFSPDFQITIPS